MNKAVPYVLERCLWRRVLPRAVANYAMAQHPIPKSPKHHQNGARGGSGKGNGSGGFITNVPVCSSALRVDKLESA